MSLVLRIATTGVGDTTPPVQAAVLGEDAGGSDAQGLLDTEHYPGGDGKFPTGSRLVSLLPPAGM